MLLLLGAGIFAIIVLPLVIMLCAAILDHPAVGVIATGLLVTATVARLPSRCSSGPWGHGIAATIFVLLVAVTAVIALATAFAILNRFRPSATPPPPRARIVRRRGQAR